MGKGEIPKLVFLFVPTNFIPFLQPLDVAVNGVLKSLITAECTKWFGSQVAKELTEGSGVEYVLDLSLKALKKPFCNFPSNAMDVLKGKTKEFMRGWIENDMSEARGSKQETLFVQAEAQEAASDLFGGANTKLTAARETNDEVPARSTKKIGGH